MNTACTNMIKQQLRTGNVLNERILDLYHKIPRHAFVPEQFIDFAYSDMQIMLPHQQTMLTPLEEATILQSLDLQGFETVLEVGTGSGFFSALLSQLCQKVISIDYFSDFTQTAKQRLAQYQCNNVELYTGDASHGWIERAPYDAIVFTGAIPELLETHRLQLAPGGKLFAITGPSPAMKGRLHTCSATEWHSQLLFETGVPPLIDPLKKQSFVF